MHDIDDPIDRDALGEWGTARSRALAARHRNDSPDPRNGSQHRPLLESVATGAIGAIVAALWLYFSGVARGTSLETPKNLAAHLSHALGGSGARTGGELAALFFALQAATFVLVGVLGVTLMHRLRRGPLATAVTAMTLGVEGLVISLMATVGVGAVDTVSWSNVVVGGLLGVLAMGWYLWRTHPRGVARVAADDRVRIPRRVTRHGTPAVRRPHAGRPSAISRVAPALREVS